MNGTNEHEGREEKKTVSIDRAWELVQDIHKLEDENASLREQLASERALRKELVEFLGQYKFLFDEGGQTLYELESLLQKSKSLDDTI